MKQLGEAPEDVPFAIPEKWKWVRLRNLVSIAKQKIPDSDFYYIDVSGIDSVKRKICTLKKLTAGNAPSRARKVVEQGMVLYSTVRPYLLNTVVVEEIFDKFDLIASTAFATFKCLADLNNHYVWYVLQSPYFTQHVSAIQKGVAYPAVSDRDFYSSYIPIPPIEEQRRIVTKLNELLPLVETYGKEQEALEKMEKEFPDKLRASLLQEAIQGKLVPQLESEPAVAQIGEILEEMPFAIPEKWKWLKLDKFSEKRRTVSPDAITGEVELWSIPAYDAGSPERVNSKQIGSSKKEVVNGDVLLSKIVPNIKRAWIVKSNHPHKLASTEWLTFSGKNILDPEFMRQVFLSPYFRGRMMDTISGMGSLKRANPKMLQQVLIPVPPLHEQRRIVARLNELLDSVRQLEHYILNP